MGEVDYFKIVVGTIAALLAFVAYIPYLRDILRGKTKPHVYSWFVWGLTSLAIFALSFSDGAGAGSWTTLTVAVLCFAVCILGLRQGMRYVRTIDKVFLLLALVATGIWIFAKQPLISMILLCAIDLLAIMPSLRKAWKKPGEETLSLWSVNSLRHFLSIVALQHYSLITVMNPVLWVILDSCFSIMLILRRRKLSSIQKHRQRWKRRATSFHIPHAS